MNNAEPDRSRPAVGVAYAVFVYLVFVAVSAYALGFFADLVTPTTIDGTPARDAMSAAAVDLLLLAAFALQHSVMARPSFKRAWIRVVPAASERSTYVLSACLTLGLLMWAWQPVGPTLYHAHGQVRGVLLVLQGVGWLLVIRSTFLVSHTQLFGLPSAPSSSRPGAGAPPALVERSCYRYVRHPLMTGFLIVFWSASDLTAGHLLLALAMTLYVRIGTALEEQDLVAVHGADYVSYQARVPALLPVRIFRRERRPSPPVGAASPF